MSRNDANRMKLKALIAVYDLTISDVAKITGCCSRSMLSRILNEGLDGTGVWAQLERKLPEIIALRRTAFFDVEATPVEKVQTMVESLTKVA